MNRCLNCFSHYDDQLDACPYCGYYAGKNTNELYHLHPGTVLKEQFVVGQVLGFGGFGITYKAWDTKLETIVAIKEYYPAGIVNRIPGEKNVLLFAGNREREYRAGLSRFLKEARNMAKFSAHTNIVNVKDFFEENNTAYIVMEFLDGISLSEFLKMNTLDVETSVELIRSVCSALKEIHKHSIIHRDVSPDNIFLCLNGNVKLIDFGAARFSNNEEQQMTIILKPGFAPPEQYEKISTQGPWTDVYALGATLYMMLTRVKPEESTNRKVEDLLKAPRALNPDVSENLSNAVMKAMALERHMRFATVEEFEKAITGSKKVDPIDVEKKKRRRKRVLSIIAALTAVLAAGAVLGMQYLKQKEEQTLPEAEIALYYELTGEAQQDAEKEASLDAVIDSFTDSFPGVTIDAVGVDSDVYWDTLTADMETGAVAIYDSTNLTDDQIRSFSDTVSSLLDEGKNTQLCYFFGDYSVYFPDANRMPMSFRTPVMFSNKSVSEFIGTQAATLQELLDAIGNSEGIAVHKDAADAMATMFGEEAVFHRYITVVENADDFVDGKYAFYFAFSDQYAEVQRRLPARYSVISVASDRVSAEYTDIYSIAAGLSEDDRKVALAFLNYLLSDNAQDNCYLRSGAVSLPLNRNVLALYEDVFGDFAGYFENTDRYVFCATGTFPEDRVESIRVSVPPSRKGYYVDAQLNTDGLVLEVTYASGRTVLVDEGYTCAPTKLDTVGTQAITVTYEGTSAKFEVTVKERDTVQSIRVLTPPTRKGYYVGAELDTAGLVLEVTYVSGKVEQVTEDYTCDPTTLSVVGTQTITVTYEGATAEFDVVVKEREQVKSIEILSLPARKGYFVGAELDTTGMVLRVTFASGATRDVTAGFTCDPTTLNTVGSQIITVTYEGAQASFTVTVKERDS